MTADELRRMAFAMPLLNPSFPMGPYCFVGREYLVITYRTDPEALRRVVPAPLRFDVPMVRYEFIRMPDSTGFGNYTESGQVIPVRLGEERGGYVHAMYLDDDAPIAAGRELWGFPKKLAQPLLRVERDALVGTLDVGPVRVATGTMGFKHHELPEDALREALAEPGFLLKVIPHVDGTPRVCELMRYRLSRVRPRGAWAGPGVLQLFPHALAPVAGLPVLEVLSAVHLVADLTLDLGEVAHDYRA
jgi:acetoacetate decarboxylase